MKWVKIKIEFSDGTTHKIRLDDGLFRKQLMLTYNGKLSGFYSLSKLISRLRKIISEHFN